MATKEDTVTCFFWDAVYNLNEFIKPKCLVSAVCYDTAETSDKMPSCAFRCVHTFT